MCACNKLGPWAQQYLALNFAYASGTAELPVYMYGVLDRKLRSD